MYKFSIIIPTKKKTKTLAKKYNFYADSETEVIIIECNNGRGYPIAKGIKKAHGTYAIVLHADTTLPPTWKTDISNTLKNDTTIGGAFSLKFTNKHFFLTLLTFFSTLLFYIKKELWGDRAIFFRSSALTTAEIERLQVPIMEDVILSSILKKKGTLALLRSHVITESGQFRTKGILKHTAKILYCRMLFILRHDLQKIYNLYYS